MEELALQVTILEQVKSRLYSEIAEINNKIKKIEFEMELMRMGKFDADLNKIMMAYDRKEGTKPAPAASVKPDLEHEEAVAASDNKAEPIEDPPVIVPTKKEEQPTSGWLGGWWSSSGTTEKPQDNYIKEGSKPTALSVGSL